jgi:hypothetical protein
MNSFKFLLLLTAQTCVLSFATGQNLQNSDCTLDSVHFAKVTMTLDSVYDPGGAYLLLDFWFPSKSKISPLSCIVIYARVFDKLCSWGLDIEYKLSRPTRLNIINVDPSPEDLARYKQCKINNLKFYCFRDFIYLKTHYEKKIVSVYYPTKQDAAFEKIINDLVNYGGYSHPAMVKNFLLSKYDQFTMEKYEQDVKDMMK